MEPSQLALGASIVEVGSELGDALERLDDLAPPLHELRESAGAREDPFADGLEVEKLRGGRTHSLDRLASRSLPGFRIGCHDSLPGIGGAGLGVGWDLVRHGVGTLGALA